MLDRLVWALAGLVAGLALPYVKRPRSVSSEPHKMVLVVRMDLKMGKGKIAAQCGHATLGAYRRALKKMPNALLTWEHLGEAKVAVKVPNEAELERIFKEARNKGLNAYLVRDAGHTQVAPDSKTVVAIGPAPKSELDTITGELKLL